MGAPDDPPATAEDDADNYGLSESLTAAEWQQRAVDCLNRMLDRYVLSRHPTTSDHTDVVRFRSITTVPHFARIISANPSYWFWQALRNTDPDEFRRMIVALTTLEPVYCQQFVAPELIKLSGLVRVPEA